MSVLRVIILSMPYLCFFGNIVHSQLTGVVDLPSGDPLAVFVEDGYVYLANGFSGIYVVAPLNPSQTQLVSHYPISHRRAEDIWVQNRVGFIANGEIGLTIVDFSDFESPRLLSYCKNNDYAQGIYIHDNYAYLADRNGIIIVNIADPESPVLERSMPLSGDVKNIKMEGSYAFVVSLGFGLYIVDISNPARPKLVGTWTFHSDIWDLWVLGN